MERKTPIYSASESVRRGGSTYCVSIWPRASTSCGVGVGLREGVESRLSSSAAIVEVTAGAIVIEYIFFAFFSGLVQESIERLSRDDTDCNWPS